MTELLDPELALAIAYAPADARRPLSDLFALDARLAQVVRTTSEPMIGQMKLAWWREALAGERSAAGEPLLERLTTLPLDRPALAELAQGWAALLQTPLDDAAVTAHGALRGAALFGAAGRLLGDAPAPPDGSGTGWALVDLAHHLSDQAAAACAIDAARGRWRALAVRWPVPLRPLGMLAALARRDLALARRRQGSPARLLRALRFRLTGR